MTELLDGIEVACFDLFDTLIWIDTGSLPEIEFGGTSIRSTVPILHERIFSPRDVALEDLVGVMRRIWGELRVELRAQDGPDDERYKEITATEKYRRMLDQLDAIATEEIPSIAEEIADLHHACLVEAARPMEGAQELLARVRERNIATVLVSNWDHARAGQAMLAQTGLADLLDHVVISDAVGIRKPHPRIFEHALEPFAASPHAALHVGDMAEADAWGAGRLGFRTVWIDKADEGWPAELEGGPSLQVGHLRELLARV